MTQEQKEALVDEIAEVNAEIQALQEYKQNLENKLDALTDYPIDEREM